MKNKLRINLEVTLVEIILSILIFAIAGTIILNYFALAKFTQQKANDKVVAGNIIQSSAEMIKSFDNINELYNYLNSNYKTADKSSEEISYINYYDASWMLSDKSKDYFITLTFSNYTNSTHLIEINIKAEKATPYPFIDKDGENSIIYEIETKKFFPF